MFETITSLHSSPPSVLIKNARATALIPDALRNILALCSNELFLQRLEARQHRRELGAPLGSLEAFKD
jgi:hypothetical protein